MRKLTSILLVAVLVFSVVAFAACGEGPGNGGGGDKIKVEIGAGEHGFGLKWLERAISGFNASQNTYEVEIAERGPNFDTKAEQDIDTDQTKYDIYIISEVYWKHNAIKGKFVSLDDVFMSEFNDDYTIEEALLDENRNRSKAVGPDGQTHYYNLNYSTSASSLIVNMSVARFYEGQTQWNRSVKKMAQIKTVDQLNAWVKEIERLSAIIPFTYLDGSGSGTVKGWVYPGQYIQYWDAIVNTWWAQYSGVTTYKSFFEFNDASGFSDRGRLEALKAFESLKLNDHSLDCASDDHIQSQTKFAAGRAAIIPNGDWIAYESKGVFANYGTEYKMIYVPAVSGAQQENLIANAAGSLCVIPNREDTEVAGAKAFLKYFFKQENGPSYFTSETGSLWGFDGVDGTDTYASELYDELGVFAQNVIDLVNNATAHVSDTPNNFDAPNYLIFTSGTASKWNSGSMSYTNIMNGNITPQKIFDNEKAWAESNFNIWLEKIS